MALTDKLTSIANAIRGKTGKSATLTLDQMVTEISGISTVKNQNKTITENGEYTADSGYTGLGVVTVNVEVSGGGDDTLKAMIDGTLTEIELDCTKIRARAFFNYKGLEKVSFPNVTNILENAFYGCSDLAEINFPNCETVGSYVFQLCALTDVNLPKLKATNSQMFTSCTKLAVARFPSVNSIMQLTFMNCSVFKTLILANTTVVSLGNVSAFNGTPFASGGTGGTVYVPSALKSQYEQATNWSTLVTAGSLTFAAIEGSEYE